MKFYYMAFSLIIISICAGTLRSQTESKAEKTLPEVSIQGTKMMTFHSAIVDQDYDLYINLPGNYSDTTKKFPVLYVLDGQWDFTLAQSLYGQQYYDGFVPAMIVVGITWGGKNPDYDNLRARDLTPTSSNMGNKYGNAPKFLECIKKEIIPLVESNYRVDKSNRALMGSSFGGLFTLYAMLKETNLFNRYMLTSPAVNWDNGIIYTYEKEYSEKNTSLPVRLFIGWGSYEDQTVFQKFVDVLKSRNYKDFNLSTYEVQGCGHSGAKAYGFTKGFQFLYEKPSIIVDTTILQQYAGDYEIAPNMIVKLNVEDGHLVAHEPSGIKIILYSESDSDFYAKGIFLTGHFVKDQNGKVTGISVEQYNGKMFIKKL